VVLLLESLEAVVDRIEVHEDVLSQPGDAEVYLVEPAVHLGGPAADLAELAFQGFDELLVLGGLRIVSVRAARCWLPPGGAVWAFTVTGS